MTLPCTPHTINAPINALPHWPTLSGLNWVVILRPGSGEFDHNRVKSPRGGIDHNICSREELIDFILVKSSPLPEGGGVSGVIR